VSEDEEGVSETTESATFCQSRFHHDFSQIPARTTPSMAVQAKARTELNQSHWEIPHPVRGNSQALPNDLRTSMEAAFNTDFSQVKIHPNSQQAIHLGALAYTQGNHIHFSPNQYQPHSQTGRQLLGHELTHVVQQRQGQVDANASTNELLINDRPALEQEADEKGRSAANRQPVEIYHSATLGSIQRVSDEQRAEYRAIFQDYQKLGQLSSPQKRELLVKINTLLDELKDDTNATFIKDRLREFQATLTSSGSGAVTPSRRGTSISQTGRIVPREGSSRDERPRIPATTLSGLPVVVPPEPAQPPRLPTAELPEPSVVVAPEPFGTSEPEVQSPIAEELGQSAVEVPPEESQGEATVPESSEQPQALVARDEPLETTVAEPEAQEERLKPNINTIWQGALGDCWLIATIGALAIHQPDLLRIIQEKTSPEDRTRTFKVTLRVEGTQQEVTVTTAELATSTSTGRLRYANQGEKPEETNLVAPLIELALAKLRRRGTQKEYEGLVQQGTNAEMAFQALAPGKVQQVNVHGTQQSKVLMQHLQAMVGRPTVAQTRYTYWYRQYDRHGKHVGRQQKEGEHAMVVQSVDRDGTVTIVDQAKRVGQRDPLTFTFNELIHGKKVKQKMKPPEIALDRREYVVEREIWVKELVYLPAPR
jgi:hypothetical protein